MNYDKLSRALRYYYDKNIMSKVSKTWSARMIRSFDNCFPFSRGLEQTVDVRELQIDENRDYEDIVLCIIIHAECRIHSSGWLKLKKDMTAFFIYIRWKWVLWSGYIPRAQSINEWTGHEEYETWPGMEPYKSWVTAICGDWQTKIEDAMMLKCTTRPSFHAQVAVGIYAPVFVYPYHHAFRRTPNMLFTNTWHPSPSSANSVRILVKHE